MALLKILEFLLISVLFKYSERVNCVHADGACQSDVTGMPRFGPSCEYLCHCRSGETCDEISGECATSCANGWMGPGCQYRDMAFGAYARHSDNILYDYALRAVDGDSSTCSATDDKQGARTAGPWWRVFFGRLELVHGMIITTDATPGDLQDGFQITVENITNESNHTKPSDAIVCYDQAAVADMSSTFEIYCTESVVGNQLRIQLNRLDAQLVLCDVNIFGGRSVAVGKTAQAKNPVTSANLAVDGRTAIDDRSQCSTTDTVDNPWWQVDLQSFYRADTVKLFYYNADTIKKYVLSGQTYMNDTWTPLHDDRPNDSPTSWIVLQQSVRSLRIMRTASMTNLSICEIQVFGDCPDNACGLDCSTVCHCKHFSYQQKVTGICTSGCNGRWTGSQQKCDIDCGSDKWGISCQNPCGQCEGGVPCDVITGQCPAGCAAGYRLSTCTEPCTSGYYGELCQHTCDGNCLHGNSSCNHVTGLCDGGCTAGWQGERCTEICDSGFYGELCQQTCSSNCLHANTSCNHVTGQCEGGCVPGWRGAQCTSTCSSGYYGELCQQTCDGNCLHGNSSCNHVTGLCNSGCTAGWQGERCTENLCASPPPGYILKQCTRNVHSVCDSGFYGELCQQTCSSNCLHANTSCNHVTGQCEGGCVPGWRGTQCTSRYETTKSPFPVAGIAGGIVAFAVCVGVAVLVICIVRRRRERHRKPHEQVPEEPRESSHKTAMEGRDGYEVMSNVHNASAVDEHAYDSIELGDIGVDANSRRSGYIPCIPTEVPDSAIYLTDLAMYVTNRVDLGKLDEEFTSIPSDLQYPIAVARKPSNMKKNRFLGVYPYDHSRVKLRELPGQPDTDYINASYIDGYNNTRTYIAAQDPSWSNADDFLRMIWEKNVDTVVWFSCPPEENKKMMSDAYWHKENGGMFQVTVTSEERSEMMIVRKLDVACKSQSERRTLTQYDFTRWGKNCPDVTALVLFLHKCRANYKNNGAPVVVHCSAGISKTGTYIALDILYDQGNDLGYVDVLGVVRNLREQRVKMVQTKNQYMFLHEAVYEALVQQSPVPVDSFLEVYTQLLETDKRTQKCHLLDQYAAIQESVLSQKARSQIHGGTDDDEFPAAESPENKGKNRDDDILVADKFRPTLFIKVKGSNDYINAVCIQSRHDSRAILLSQIPLSHTAVDCCRLIYERSITCVVMFEYDEMKQDEMYLSPKGRLSVGPFETTLVSTEDKDDYIVNNLEMTYKGDVRAVRQFVYNDWITSQNVPASMKSFLRLVDMVGDIQITSDGPILVHCMNGAHKSGLFAVMLNVVERMKTEGHVAIPQIIRMLRRRRQQIIPNYEQYKFCHDAVQYHLKMKRTDI